MTKKSPPGLGLERELKFAQADLEALRQRLLEVEAERTGPAVFEENWLLDRAGELAKKQSVLRVRAEEGLFVGDTQVDVEHAAAVGMPLPAF